jgi:hypothetical protein
VRKTITNFSIDHPWIVIGLAVAITIFFALQFPKIKIDTDPENMLAHDEPVRVFNDATKEDFALSDFLAVGVVKESGAFTPQILNNVYKITAEIEDMGGVIVDDILAPSTVDDINQNDQGVMVIGPLMDHEISTQEEADYILSRIVANPILRGKLASDDGKAIALFVPLESKNLSHDIALKIKALTEKYGTGEEYHIAGLPMAEDSFGTEMFGQMMYSAPAAMLIIFLLLFMFFRNFKVILAPMIVAMMSVIWSMGLLIMSGFTVHIMASMIPIFLMPIAVLNSIHIISEFHDYHKKMQSKAEAIRHSIKELFVPMLFTSMTTVAGFISLMTTPIPPVRVFGGFVAFGIIVAWFLSLTINPAIGSIISEKALEKFGSVDTHHGILARILHGLRNLARRRPLGIVITALVVMVIAGYGLTKIVVNDNPVRWFKESHPIRIADAIMNKHLAGTYMNYLVFTGDEPDMIKEPEVMAYIESVQNELAKHQNVGSTTGVTDVVKKVRLELFDGDKSQMYLPDNYDEIGQMLFMFEMSGGDPDDLFKFVTEDYAAANVWVQMRAGDNLAVSSVVDDANKFLAENPPPKGLSVEWAGLPYINIEWQHQMVTGMGKSLMGSFIIVFLMMIFLFRSLKWGIISMLPLSITIMAIYGFIGYIGKPYDMPVAVLSSLTLGLSIDFAIHFIQRFRMLFDRLGNFDEAYNEIFEGAGRAILRNVLVIAIGFVPMLFSNLVPYITVGSFFLAIMIVSGLVTMILLPAITQLFHKSLFKEKSAVAGSASIEG